MFDNLGGPSLADMHSNPSSSGSVFDQAHNSRGGTSGSIFDRNGEEPTRNEVNESNFSSFNIRANYYGSMGVLESKMGIAARREDLDFGDISLAETHMDKSLDNRVMGGYYNYTMSDMYGSDRAALINQIGVRFGGMIEGESDLDSKRSSFTLDSGVSLSKYSENDARIDNVDKYSSLASPSELVKSSADFSKADTISPNEVSFQSSDFSKADRVNPSNPSLDPDRISSKQESLSPLSDLAKADKMSSPSVAPSEAVLSETETKISDFSKADKISPSLDPDRVSSKQESLSPLSDFTKGDRISPTNPSMNPDTISPNEVSFQSSDFSKADRVNPSNPSLDPDRISSKQESLSPLSDLTKGDKISPTNPSVSNENSSFADRNSFTSQTVAGAVIAGLSKSDNKDSEKNDPNKTSLEEVQGDGLAQEPQAVVEKVEEVEKKELTKIDLGTSSVSRKSSGLDFSDALPEREESTDIVSGSSENVFFSDYKGKSEEIKERLFESSKEKSVAEEAEERLTQKEENLTDLTKGASLGAATAVGMGKFFSKKKKQNILDMGKKKVYEENDAIDTLYADRDSKRVKVEEPKKKKKEENLLTIPSISSVPVVKKAKILF